MFKAIKEFFGFYDKPVVPEVKQEAPVEAKPVKQPTTQDKKPVASKPATKTRSAAVAKGTKGRKKK